MSKRGEDEQEGKGVPEQRRASLAFHGSRHRPASRAESSVDVLS